MELGPDTSVLKDEQRSVSGIWIWQARARVGWSVVARRLGTNKEEAGWSGAGMGGAGGGWFGSNFRVGVEWHVTLRHPSGDSRKGGSLVQGFARGIRTRNLDLGVTGVHRGRC